MKIIHGKSGFQSAICDLKFDHEVDPLEDENQWVKCSAYNAMLHARSMKAAKWCIATFKTEGGLFIDCP